MNNDNTASNEDEGLRADVTAIGAAKAPSHEIAPEDQPIADRILAMDPFKENPSPHKWPEGRRQPAYTLAALNPEMRKQAEERLSALQPSARAAAESTVVHAILEDYARYSLSSGSSAYGLPYHGEMRQIALDYRELAREFDRLQDDLAEVHSFGMERDPDTGQARPKEILKIQGPRRAGYLARMEDLSRRMRLLHNAQDGSPGLEAATRLKKALAESVGVLKTREAEIAEHEEAKRLGAERARQARIDARAEVYARRDPRGGL